MSAITASRDDSHIESKVPPTGRNACRSPW